MPLQLKVKNEVSIDGTKIIVIDDTQQYTVNNIGGWGSGNGELDEYCLVACVVRKDSAGDQFLEPITTQAVHDSGAANNKQTEFEFTYMNDGSHEIYLFRIPVSTDGINYLTGGTVQEGDYYFRNNVIYLQGAVDPEEVEPQDLIGIETVMSALCEEFLLARLAIERQKIYKEYRKKRITQCDDADSILKELVELREDIQGATYAFYSDLKIEAQDQAESLLDKYQLT